MANASITIYGNRSKKEFFKGIQWQQEPSSFREEN